MIEVRASVCIQRPIAEVFGVISDFENNPRWQSGMVEAKFTSDGQLRVGSTYDQVAKFLGRRVLSSFEVIALEPDHLIKITSTSGSFAITVTRITEALDGGTQVTAIVQGDAGGFFKLAEPLLARLVQRSVSKDYVNLKRLLEADDGHRV